MSELRVDNIVSQDGTAAPIYSKGLNIGAGVTLTNNGDFVVGGATSIAGAITASNTGTVSLAGGVTVAGVTTISNTLNVTGSQTVGGSLSVSGNQTVTGRLDVTGGGSFNTTGVGTFGTLNVSGATSFGDITGTISNLVVGAGASIVGVTTAASFEQADGAKVATTGKAIAMSMVFGG